MSVAYQVRRLWERVLSVGSYPGEPDSQRGPRRITVGMAVIFLVGNLTSGFSEFSAEMAWLAASAWATAVAIAAALLMLRARPQRFAAIINSLFLFTTVVVSVETILLGGIQPSSAQILWGILAVLGALIALSLRSAMTWFAAFLVGLTASAVLPTWIDPLYIVEGSSAEFAVNIGGVTVLVFATMVYFVRQRDHLQKQSDDLLHNILPDEIAARLKQEKAMIADDYEAASVLFADVVDFTPMSAGMSPPQLVRLLNTVFSTFDSFVAELGLEKIKTVGDEYMVASGVPHPRSDHATAIARLALRIREHAEKHTFDGHKINLRIGISSGPVVAGIVGTHKFSYDLWGDVVNTASRMESEGVPGSIQITSATYELINKDFVCEPRGPIQIKGKGEMNTYFLLSLNPNGDATSIDRHLGQVTRP